jgi:hypothetical protein
LCPLCTVYILFTHLYLQFIQEPCVKIPHMTLRCSTYYRKWQFVYSTCTLITPVVRILWFFCLPVCRILRSAQATLTQFCVFELRVSVHRDLMNKIPTRCSNSVLFYFPLFSALHVSGVTITHHQELPLCIRVWYNNINRSVAERSGCQNRVGGG